MFPEILLPDASTLRLIHQEFDPTHQCLNLCLETTVVKSYCPLCQQITERIHSRYTRHLADLPCMEWQVSLQLNVRKFFCDNRTCERKIFTERVPKVARPWARRTERLREVQQKIALLVSSEVMQQISDILQMSTSADTLLRLVRQTETPNFSSPRVLGVDDWEFRKGQRYGTILVDLERHQVLDLLPDRRAETLTKWLKTHPGIEIISRDRAGTYADGATQGAPQAKQIADRWHLLKNLADALTKVLNTYRRKLQQTTHSQFLHQSSESDKPNTSTSCQERHQAYQIAVELAQQGMAQKAIAHQLNRHPRTIRRWLRAGEFTEIHRSGRKSMLDPFKSHMIKRWNEGCWNAAKLYREIQDLGYSGGMTIVRDFVQRLRTGQGLLPKARSFADARFQKLTPRQAAHIILMNPNDYDEEQRVILNHIQKLSDELQHVVILAQDFAVMLRQRQGDRFDAWLAKAEATPILRHFAQGLRRDYQAIRAGLSEIWSNGQVEGQVNRLKFIKRQMYGRANFDLLRIRVLAR